MPFLPESIRPRPATLVIAALAVWSAAGMTEARAADPVQWWNAFTAGFDLPEAGRLPATSIDAKAEFRVAEGGDVLTWNAEASWLLPAGRRFQWGPGYKYQELRAPGGPFRGEHRFLMTGKVKLAALKGWQPGLRVLYEFRDREDLAESWRGRLRADAQRAVKGTPWSILVSNDFFWDSATDRYSQNRLLVGGRRRPAGGLDFSVYYLLRSDRRDRHWEETQIVGTIWSF